MVCGRDLLLLKYCGKNVQCRERQEGCNADARLGARGSDAKCCWASSCREWPGVAGQASPEHGTEDDDFLDLNNLPCAQHM